MGSPTVQLNVRITPELRAALNDLTRANGTTVNEVVSNAIQAAVDAAAKGETK
jgi:predicted HicB family RNase H-like nuclease